MLDVNKFITDPTVVIKIDDMSHRRAVWGCDNDFNHQKNKQTKRLSLTESILVKIYVVNCNSVSALRVPYLF